MPSTTEPTTRRSFLRLGLLSLALASPLRAMLTNDVRASKNTGKKVPSIKSRVARQRELCEVIGGGTFSAKKTPFGSTITTCTGGDKLADGVTCVHTKKSTTCTQAAPPPQPPLPDLTQDPVAPHLTAPSDVIHHGVEADSPPILQAARDTSAAARSEKNTGKHHGRGHGNGGKRR